MLQPSVGGQDITVARLAYCGRAGNYDVGVCPRHIHCGVQRERERDRVEKRIIVGITETDPRPL